MKDLQNTPISNNKLRQPNIELLRLVAIILISFMHGIKCAYGSENQLNAISFVLVNAVGNMGVTVFILISGYFGIQSKVSKLFRLWGIILFYSLLLFFVSIYLSGQELPYIFYTKSFYKDLYTALTPITSGTWWFFTSYTILFMLAPLFNKAADCMTKRQFLYLIVVLLFFYSISPTFLMHSLSNTPNGKCTENMILAYFIGRYIAKYGIPDTIRHHAFSIWGGCLLLISFIDYFIFDPLFMAKDHNLFIIIGALCLFLYFHKSNIHHPNIDHVICYIATYVFPIYLLNWKLIEYLEPLYIGYSNENSFMYRFLLVQIGIITISIMIEWIRRILFDKSIHKIEKYINDKTTPVFNNIFYSK